jgi:hypothetical protein
MSNRGQKLGPQSSNVFNSAPIYIEVLILLAGGDIFGGT